MLAGEMAQEVSVCCKGTRLSSEHRTFIKPSTLFSIICKPCAPTVRWVVQGRESQKLTGQKEPISTKTEGKDQQEGLSSSHHNDTIKHKHL